MEGYYLPAFAICVCVSDKERFSGEWANGSRSKYTGGLEAMCL